jgi:addiction module HigA family antidote
MDLSTRVEDRGPAAPLVHPGTILLNEWMMPRDFSQNGLARRLGVPPRRINEIVLGKRGISADTAIGLAAVFGTTERYWMSLQADYELAVARSRRSMLERIGVRHAAPPPDADAAKE